MADKEDPKKGPSDGEPKGPAQEVDPKIAEIMKDPDAVQKLLEAKRAANEEAKKYRLEIERRDQERRDAEKKTLEEEGKFKELAEKSKADAERLAANFKAKRIDFEIKLEATRAGAIDPDDIRALCDRKAIKVSDDLETVDGAADAVAELKKTKPHLFKGEGDSGSRSNPRTEDRPALRGVINKTSDSPMDPLDRIRLGLKNPKK